MGQLEVAVEDLHTGLIALDNAKTGASPSPRGAVLSVANAAALAALQTSVLLPGAIAYVGTYGAYWSYRPDSTAAPSAGTVTAALGGGNWIRFASGIGFTAQLQAVWNIDPQGIATPPGNDEATGLSGAPLASVAEVFRRWGTPRPFINQTTTITWFSNGLSTDPWTGVRPSFGPSGSLILTGQSTIVATTTIGTATAPNYAAGVPGKITASGQSAAYWTPFVGMLCVDLTQNASFFIYADVGGATAEITTAFVLPVTLGATYATPTAGDTLHILSFPTIYGNSFDSDGSFLGPLTINRLTLNATGTLDLTCSASFGLQLTEVVITTITGGVISCSVSNTVLNSVWVFDTDGFSPWSGAAAWLGGAVIGAGATFASGTTWEGDLLIQKRFHYSGGQIQIFRAYWGEAPTIDSPPVDYLIQTGGAYDTQRLWGPGGLNISAGARFACGTAASGRLLLTGTLQCDGGNGFPFIPSTHVFGPAVTITATSIDANGNLQNPQTGSKFFVGG